MGYTTVFQERFKLDRPLLPEHAAYLARFADTRRMKRVQIMLNDLPDPLRIEAGLPLGRQGGYFVAGEAANDPLGAWDDDPSVTIVYWTSTPSPKAKTKARGMAMDRFEQIWEQAAWTRCPPFDRFKLSSLLSG